MTRKIDGRKAVVINSGKTYRHYGHFARSRGYSDAYAELGTTDKRGKLENGDEVTLLVSGPHGSASEGTLWIVERANGDRYIIGESGLNIEPQPDVLGLIANLSTRLAEAERKIAALEGAKAANEAPDVLVSRPLTRDDVIERAKADVAELSKTHWNGSGDIVYKRGIFLYKAEFIVNRDKRTVVCLLRSYTDNDVAHRGIAKCAPDDVFNMHIGRAIALRRALGLNVPEAYTDAPKPTEAKVGDIVRWIGQNGSCRKDSEILTIKERYYPRGETAERVAWRFSDGDWDYANSFEILDDSREETEVDRLICRYLISR